MVGQPGFWPCTPYGCMKMLESIGFELKGKHAVKQVDRLLSNKGIRVWCCRALRMTARGPISRRQRDGEWRSRPMTATA